MSNSPQVVRLMAQFTRDLLGVSNSTIAVGRTGKLRGSADSAQIVIDTLGGGRLLANGKDFDGDAEEVAYSLLEEWRVTVDFYGDGAYDNAQSFRLRCLSEKARQLSSALGIAVHIPSRITDVKRLLGAKAHRNRYQIEVIVHHSTSEAVDTLRIDTAQVTVYTENTEVEL